MDRVVPFEFSNSLLFTSSILLGFTSLIIVSKEWIDKRVWPILVPPLALIILSGVAIGNLALGNSNSVVVLLYSSAAFNANVVSTGLSNASTQSTFDDTSIGMYSPPKSMSLGLFIWFYPNAKRSNPSKGWQDV
jgi:hypothetical protein